MNCKWTKLLISHYVGLGLDQKRKKIFAKHLEKCHICRKEVNRLVTTVKIISEIEEIDPPRDYVEAVRACLNKY